MLAAFRRNLTTILVAMVTAAVTAGGPAIAATIADYANNADKVDNKHAVGAGASPEDRAGKLVATNSAGQLPNNIITKAPDAQKLDGRDSTQFASQADLDAALARIAQLETLLAGASRVEAAGQDTLRLANMNLQIVNGNGATDGTPNGRGNLIVGYNTPRGNGSDKSGSHYVITGDEHNYTRFGGIVAGKTNTASGDWSSVSGGNNNTASGLFASVSGGFNNTGSGIVASVSGGASNTASNDYASVSGGNSNTASHYFDSVSGGFNNTAMGGNSSVSGGSGNTASGGYASVSGGDSNTASATYASVSGGYGNTAGGFASSVLGGEANTVSVTSACHPSCS